MCMSLQRRRAAYAELLVNRIKAVKGYEYKTKLTRPRAKDFADYVKSVHPTLAVKNVARDIAALVNGGKKFDAGFAMLYYGSECPQFIERYSATYLAEMIRGVFSPQGVDARLKECIAGKRVYEEL